MSIIKNIPKFPLIKKIKIILKYIEKKNIDSLLNNSYFYIGRKHFFILHFIFLCKVCNNRFDQGSKTI